MISLVYEARPGLDLTENRHSVTHRYRGLKIIKRLTSLTEVKEMSELASRVCWA